MGAGTSSLYAHSPSIVQEDMMLPSFYPGECFYIGKSLGAAALNYDIRDPGSGKHFKFAEGSVISDVVTFAGKGTRNPLKREVVEGLVRQYGGKRSDWKHSKGIGTIDRGTTFQTAEVHWFENKDVKVGFKIKRWM